MLRSDGEGRHRLLRMRIGLHQRAGTVAVLGSAQTLSWASTYYLPAMLAAPMARDLGVSTPTVFAAFSAALMVSALTGPYAGRTIDKRGGRPVLMATNVVFALGLAMLGLADGALGLFVAWVVLGLGMGSGLYEAAFATLVRLHGRDSRNLITGITLIAGFASTVGWPLTTLLEAQFGWRGACFAWAALQLLLGLPLNALLPGVERADPGPAPAPAPAAKGGEVASQGTLRTAVLLSLMFAATGFISTAMASHFPRLLQAAGATLATAVAVGALIGPAQVAARLMEFGFLRRVHPVWSARFAVALHPLGVGVLLVVGAPAAAVFGLLHGAGNGILTIAKGTLPLELFGAHGYGRRQGLLVAPARVAHALAPWLFGVCLDRWGADALWLSAGLGAVALATLFLLPHRHPAAQGASAASSV